MPLRCPALSRGPPLDLELPEPALPDDVRRLFERTLAGDAPPATDPGPAH
ncbi:MAG: hypothetical protein WCF36_18875 [Candidatus Nanopelagicales bacterium]